MDDQAAGVKSLWDRPYVNKERVGIFGTSYGGYASAMCLLRYPDVFAAACAQSAVTSWNQYDTSTPSATCGSRRRTRKATRPAAP